MLSIDLNADIGESFGIYKIGSDSELVKYITSANIACGLHGGDPIVISKTIEMAKKHNVSIGAHPSYPDLQGFGRRDLNLSLQEIECFILYQLGAIYAFSKANNVELKHVKPHGALYNAAAKDFDIALAIATAIYKFDHKLILVGLSNSKLIEAANHIGLKAAKEVFADRMYDDNGFLVSRKIAGSVINDIDIATNRAIEIVKYKKVRTINDKIINLEGDTICIHTDTPKAKEFAENIVSVFKKENINILPLYEVLH